MPVRNYHCKCGNWQTQGYGTPIYININYPFVRNRPYVTQEPPRDWTAYARRNPVGSYVTFFNATDKMLSQNVILHFGGVKSAMYVWVNGKKVGLSNTIRRSASSSRRSGKDRSSQSLICPELSNLRIVYSWQ